MQSKRTDDFAGTTPSLGASSLRVLGREQLPLTSRSGSSILSLPLPPILRTGLAGIALALGLWGTSPHADAAILNGVDFSYIYDGSADPTNPPWTLPLGNGSGTSSGGIFTITTTASENRYYLMTAGSGIPWNATASDGTTVEFRMQVVSQASGAGSGATTVTLTNGSRNFLLAISDSGISINGDSNTAYSLNTTQFNTYRLVLDGAGATATMSVYVNDSATPVISNYTSTSSNANNRLYFGDPTNQYGGITHWDYVAFTNDGAFPVIPEPGSIALAGMAGAFLILRGLRKANARREH